MGDPFFIGKTNVYNFKKSNCNHTRIALIALTLASILPGIVCAAEQNTDTGGYQEWNPFCSFGLPMQCEPPLRDVFFGVDLNVLRPMANSNEMNYSPNVGGGLSIFDVSKGMELYVPVFVQCMDCNSDTPYRYGTVDVRIRKYQKDKLNGAYFGGVVRATRINGPLRGTYSSITHYVATYATEEKYGVGAEFGFRLFFTKRIYWGAGFLVGWYCLGENEKFIRGDIWRPENEALILDADLFKVGFAF